MAVEIILKQLQSCFIFKVQFESLYLVFPPPDLGANLFNYHLLTCVIYFWSLYETSFILSYHIHYFLSYYLNIMACSPPKTIQPQSWGVYLK